MNLFQKRSLKHVGIYILVALFLILLVQYTIIRYKIEVLEEVEEKKDFARGAQLEGQQVALLVQEYLTGQNHLSAEIVSRLEQQDHTLEVLENGGRIDGTEIFIQPLSRLPKMSFNQLNSVWKSYKENVLKVVVNEQPAVQDSTLSATAINPVESRTMLPAKWITLSSWYNKLEADLTDEAEEKKSSVENWVLAFIFFDVLLIGGLFYLLYQFVITPIRLLKESTDNQIQNKLSAPDEIEELNTSVNEVLEQLKDATEFVSAIATGNLAFDYKTLDTQYAEGKNKLADSLISMQNKLKDMNAEEARRQWANEGLTKFVDILRSSNDNIVTLGDKIISSLVQYTGSNQGGLYVLNDEDENNKYLELMSLFAFNLKKFEKQKIRLGEGLLGQTFLEKETTVLNEIPDEYIRITSGLGDANPKSILAVPLKLDKEVYGIVELASFKDYQRHEIEFVEKLAETIASTLGSVKAAQKNKHLIEQFQQQTEEMRAQEEEMRQNMEELQATQEEMARKEKDYISRIQELESAGSESSEEQIAALTNTFQEKEIQLKRTIADIQEKLNQKPERSDDWAVAEEVEKTLKFQLEALRVTQEEIEK
jgi:putative methionine-R-sulfoxide reductase with GAF domain